MPLLNHRALTLAGLLLLALSTTALAELRIASWNVLHLGWNNGKNIEAMAAVAEQFDFLAVQELMEPAALTRLRDTLEQRTGVPWRQLTSDAAGRSSYREHYGFLWRTDKATYVDGAVSYLDRGDIFAREPFSARFKGLDTGDMFAVGTVHVRFGDGREDRASEIRALSDYWRWLGEIYTGTEFRLLMGDFNLEPGDPAWRALDENARGLITRGGSTLSIVPGQYANPYDNIFIPDDYELGAASTGIFTYPQVYRWDWFMVRKHVSDHVPVYLVLGAQEFVLRKGNGFHNSGVTAATVPTDCIDLNHANAEQLGRLVHVGPARAEAIIRGRPWRTVDELVRVRGLGEASVGDITASGQVCPL